MITAMNDTKYIVNARANEDSYHELSVIREYAGSDAEYRQNDPGHIVFVFPDPGAIALEQFREFLKQLPGVVVSIAQLQEYI